MFTQAVVGWPLANFSAAPTGVALAATGGGREASLRGVACVRLTAGPNAGTFSP